MPLVPAGAAQPYVALDLQAARPGSLRRAQKAGTFATHLVASRRVHLPHKLTGFAEGMGLFWLAGMANGVRFFAPPFWKIEQAAKRAARNPYYED